jgi:hypothetical protein
LRATAGTFPSGIRFSSQGMIRHKKWVTIVWYCPNSAGGAMRVRIRLLVQLVILLGAGAYLFLHMQWLEDRPAPFAAPLDAGPHHHYISELSFRA